MRQRAWMLYLGLLLPAVAASTFVPGDGWLPVLWQAGIGYAAAAAILVGVRIHRPQGTAGWYWLGVGIVSNASGIVVEELLLRTRGEVTLPSPADIAYLGMYPALCVALALFIRRQEPTRNWPALVDTTTISTGLGLLSWVFLMRPPADDPALTVLGRIVSIGYPVGDLILLAMTVRLLIGGRSASRAFALITGSLVLFLAGDTAWAVVNKLQWTPDVLTEHVLRTLAVLAYTLLGAAALHPSMQELGHRRSEPRTGLSGRMLVLLAAATMIAPTVLAIELGSGRVTDGVAIVIGSVALFLLVVTRMAQLIRQVQDQAAKLRELARVDELTGLPNRRAWSVELPLAIERARRDRTPLSVAMLDLDHFKRFNDEFGHPAGDRLLKGAAAAWTGELRAVDQLARYGGEEFILLLPGADVGFGRQALGRLAEVTPLGQTFSAGLAGWNGIETSDELIARADRALYQAKRDGRNRVHTDAATLEEVAGG